MDTHDVDIPNFVSNAAALLQWSCGDGGNEYLGCECPVKSSRLVANIRLDPVHTALSFRFRVAVALKEPASQRQLLFLHIHPDQMSCVEQRALDDAEASPLGATTFIAKTSECSSPKDILCLSLTLKTPMTVVGPATITHLAPRTAAAGRILEALASLSTATDVTIYLPSNPDSCGQADTLCNMVNSGKAQAIPNDYALDMLYHGAGGHILTSLLARFDRQQPPSYQSLSGNEAERPLKRKCLVCRMSPPP